MKTSGVWFLFLILFCHCTKKKHEEPVPQTARPVSGTLAISGTEYTLDGSWTHTSGYHIQAVTPQGSPSSYTLTIQLSGLPPSDVSYDFADASTAAVISVTISGSDVQQVFTPSSGMVQIQVSSGTPAVLFSNATFESSSEAIVASADVKMF